MNYIEWLAYFMALSRGDNIFTTGEAIEHCILSRQTVHTYLRKFVKSGYIVKISRGKYAINLENNAVRNFAITLMELDWS